MNRALHFKAARIQKVDDDRREVFGWFSVVEEDGHLVVDEHGDTIEPAELEQAAYDFNLFARTAGQQHERVGVGTLIESMVFTKEKQAALGIDLGLVGWWGGFHITDDATWQAIKTGTAPMFSIGGQGIREEVEDDG